MTRLKELWAPLKRRYQTLPRLVQMAVIGLGLGMVGVTIKTVVIYSYNYRAQVRDEIAGYRDELEHLRAYVARAENVERERELLSKRLDGLTSRLMSGDTGTLAAAHLQDQVTTIAGETGVNVQSTQVMREERVGVYRRVTVRLTVRATIKAMAEFLNKVEYGTRQLSVPFLQVNRRGAAARRGRAKAHPKQLEQDRILSATVEVSGLAVGEVAEPETATES